MNNVILDSICKTVYQRFPEMKGSRPIVSNYSDTHVLLVFKAKATTADGHAIQRAVRVVASKEGKISKMTTSR